MDLRVVEKKVELLGGEVRVVGEVVFTDRRVVPQEPETVLVASRHANTPKVVQLKTPCSSPKVISLRERRFMKKEVSSGNTGTVFPDKSV